MDKGVGVNCNAFICLLINNKACPRGAAVGACHVGVKPLCRGGMADELIASVALAVLAALSNGLEANDTDTVWGDCRCLVGNGPYNVIGPFWYVTDAVSPPLEDFSASVDNSGLVVVAMELAFKVPFFGSSVVYCGWSVDSVFLVVLVPYHGSVTKNHCWLVSVAMEFVVLVPFKGAI